MKKTWWIHSAVALILTVGTGAAVRADDAAPAATAVPTASVAPAVSATAGPKVTFGGGLDTYFQYNVAGGKGIVKTPEEALAIAKQIKYPVIIKATAGGGGKGLRVAWNETEAREGFDSCVSEARTAFGDGRVFVEKFIEEPRHIEIRFRVT